MRIDFDPGQPKAFCAEKLIEWISQSQDRNNWANATPLTLPPLQRNGVWRPRQVLDLWRSVLNGLPIGLFYIQPASPRVVDPRDRANITSSPEVGWDLFDGQQRARALALGAGDPFTEGRCIWVRFKDDAYELVLSSWAQPAGYSPDGTKHRVVDRRRWQAGTPPLAKAEDWCSNAPFPMDCSEDDTARLAHLLQSAAPLSMNATLTAKVAACKSWQKETANLRKSGCAIFMLLPELIARDPRRTYEMFRRIGAGGTPLSEDEQVYAAYKLHNADLRLVVERIHAKVSAVLTPAQIVQAGLRVAYTKTNPSTGNVPSFDLAIQALLRGNEATEEWVNELDRLLAPKDQIPPLEAAFHGVRNLLKKEAGQPVFYLPDITMAQLQSQAWQVLVFWRLQEGRARLNDRKEAVRFALFWHLAVTNHEQAARSCFRFIAAHKSEAISGYKLYKQLRDAKHCLPLATPDQLKVFFTEVPADKTDWLSEAVRFPTSSEHHRFASTWWFGSRMLTWLQRDYVAGLFVSHSPLSDHEEDLPYDVDHICARSLWKADGRSVSLSNMGFNDPKAFEKAMGNSWMVGETIGNKRLVKFSQNRGDGAGALRDKMPFLNRDSSPDWDRELFGEAEDFLMNHENAELWLTADIPEHAETRHQWSPKRRKAFQVAVEHRTESMYRTFFNSLGFAEWCDPPDT
jgi:hypothetical protein